MTLEVATAVFGALFVFCLVLLVFGDGQLPMLAAKNPIGFTPPA
jgi:hypothetical protein